MLSSSVESQNNTLSGFLIDHSVWKPAVLHETMAFLTSKLYAGNLNLYNVFTSISMSEL